MQNNITVLNSDTEWKDGNVAKPGNTKYTKAAKLSTHQVFKTKTKELMEKARTPKEETPVTPSEPKVETPTEQQTEVTPAVPETPAPVQEVAPVQANVTNFLPDDKINEKVKNLNITCLPGPIESTVLGGKKIRVIPDVVASTKHTYQVVGTTEPTQEVTQASEPMASEVVPEGPAVPEPAPVPTEVNEEVTPEETAAPTFDFGQKLNIGEINNEEVAPEETQEVQTSVASTNDINNIKEEKLTNYLNNNYGQEANLNNEVSEEHETGIKGYADAIENLKTSNNELDSQIAAAEEKNTALSQDYNAAIVKLKEYRDKLEEEKLSRTMRLKALDSQNAEMEWAIAMSNKISDEDYEEDSLGGKSLSA